MCCLLRLCPPWPCLCPFGLALFGLCPCSAPGTALPRLPYRWTLGLTGMAAGQKVRGPEQRAGGSLSRPFPDGALQLAAGSGYLPLLLALPPCSGPHGSVSPWRPLARGGLGMPRLLLLLLSKCPATLLVPFPARPPGHTPFDTDSLFETSELDSVSSGNRIQ